MRVLVGMSGGVDSSVSAALLVEAGHEVVGATLKLWGGASDSGCCSAREVIDARRVADDLGIAHHVFNYEAEFDEAVVSPFVAAHARGETPNPCVECNRQVKFGSFLARARRLGFDALATGHYARRVQCANGEFQLVRGRDAAKDQSYVLSVLSASELDAVLFPLGALTKPDVRAIAAAHGLRTATKAESQDLCFISSRLEGQSRANFLGERIALHRGTVKDGKTGESLGEVDAIELVTVGQRRGLGRAAEGTRQYALDVDVAERTVRVGDATALEVRDVVVSDRTYVHRPIPTGTAIEIQASAHGRPRHAIAQDFGFSFAEPSRRIAPGQLVAFYAGETVLGSGIAR